MYHIAELNPVFMSTSYVESIYAHWRVHDNDRPLKQCARYLNILHVLGGSHSAPIVKRK